MTIAFIHPFQSFLPELTAYETFFRNKGVEVLQLTPQQWSSGAYHPDVEWVIMGHDWKKLGKAIRIHEYPSSSTPPFPSIKNLAKRYSSVKPHFRLFLNKPVQDRMGFRDSIPFGYRDIGIDPPDNIVYPTEKKYDFIYIGSCTPDRELNKLLDRFTIVPLSSSKLLILSKNYDYLKKAYSACENIFFEGPVPHESVYQYIRQATYGINFMPDKLPFNEQTSTKFLEYLRENVPVLTTRYKWITDFARSYGGNYFFIDNHQPSFSLEELETFPFSTPVLTDWYWERRIRESGVMNFLRHHFPGL